MKRYNFYVSKAINKEFQEKKFGRQGSKQLRDALDRGLDKAQLIEFVKKNLNHKAGENDKEVKLVALSELQSKEIDDISESLRQMGLSVNRSTIIEFLLTIVEPKAKLDMKKRMYYIPEDILELLDNTIKKQTTTLNAKGSFVRRKDEVVQFVESGAYTSLADREELERLNPWTGPKQQLQLVLDVSTDQFINDEATRLYGESLSKYRTKVLCDIFRQYVQYHEDNIISQIREVKLMLHKAVERSVDLVGWEKSKVLMKEVVEIYELEGGNVVYPTTKEELIYPGNETEVEYDSKSDVKQTAYPTTEERLIFPGNESEAEYRTGKK